jgi:hypothetical protein
VQLAQNVSDLGVRLSATIEPACRAEAGGERTDLTDGIAADGLRRLRPRDVRSDNAGRRPPEMRRSCQPKAVECGGGPDNLCLATDAFCSCDTTKQSNTHSTESREVLYPWHAWHGRPVWIHQAMVKNGVAIFHCGLEQAASRLLQVPHPRFLLSFRFFDRTGSWGAAADTCRPWPD